MNTANQFLRIWHITVIGALVWWVAGLNFFIYHVVSALLFIQLLFIAGRENRGVVISPSLRFLLIVFFAYLFSLVIHAPSAGGYRVAAALYNLSFWAMGLMLVLVLSNAFSPKEIRPFLRVFFYFSWVLFLVFLGAGLFHGTDADRDSAVV